MPSLFKEFSRADLQKVNILGSGLGLYLAKKFTEAQKGKVWAESDGKDKGSQFYIKFPEVKNS
jgi:signal transduction histidine kinase